MKSDMLNLVIVDDHPIIGLALRERLAPYPFNIVGVLHRLEELVSLPVEAAAINLWIIDLELGSSNSWNLIAQLSALPHPPGIVVYTMHGSPWVKERLTRLNVRYMVDKSDSIEELDNAIRAYFKGEPYASSSFRDNVGSGSLTLRETEVLSLLVKGMSTSEIAHGLNISQNTVQTYRKSLMAKFDVHKVADLISKTRGLV